MVVRTGDIIKTLLLNGSIFIWWNEFKIEQIPVFIRLHPAAPSGDKDVSHCPMSHGACSDFN